MTHIINRLELDLNCSDEEQALNIRHNFSLILLDKITEATDSICSRLIGNDQWVKIDKLEIDLGTFHPSNFEQEFGELFFQELEKEIVRRIPQLSATEKATSKNRAQTDLLRYFLQYGLLPWWADGESTDINEIFSELWKNQQATLKDFFYEQRFNTTIWQRAAFQLSTVNKMALAGCFIELQSAMDSSRKWVSEATKFSFVEPTDAETVLTAFNNIMLRNAGPIIEEYPQRNTSIGAFEETMHLHFPTETTAVDELVKQIKITEKPNTQDQLPAKHGNMDAQYAEKPGENRLDGFLETSRHSIITQALQDEKLPVRHAGIILLAAFLHSFFSNLGLVESGAWKGKNEQYRAVHLLKFLSTGTQLSPEFNLTLEKIICGMNPAEPLPVDVMLTDAEINEAQDLLKSVIEHWKALKNTSVNGLRASFLKRDGTLQKKETGWLLQVERKTLDVLIDSIPWGYSTLYFPWTDQNVLVEW